VKGGDISNETPPRLIVLAEVVADFEEVTEGKFLRKETSLKLKNINKPAVSQLWTLTYKYGLAVELAGIEEEGWTESSLEKVMDILDRRGTNPFNLFQIYTTTEELVDDLPYRNNLKGVIDIPTKILRYGSWGVDLERL
jgi:hypothetical protein